MNHADPIRAVLFDMDGVVVDSHQAVTAFWREVAAAHGVKLSDQDFHRHIYGLPASHTLDVLFAGLDGQARAGALEIMHAREAAGPYHEVPGALYLLHALRAHGIPTALVTSAEPLKVDAVCRALNLDGLFTTIINRDHISRGKPDPESYLLAAACLGLDPCTCLVLEDATSGVEAAIAAGATCIGVTSPDLAPALLTAGATTVVRDLQHIRINQSHSHRSLVTPHKAFHLPTAPVPTPARPTLHHPL